jgi:hypothetical protein
MHRHQYHDAIYLFDRAGGSNVYRYPAQSGSQGVIPSSGIRSGGYEVLDHRQQSG